MIQVKEFPNREFSTKEELFEALRESKDSLIAQKKMMLKQADSIGYVPVAKTNAAKADGNSNELKISAVINTTNLFDSHSDVHIDGLWNKTLKERKMLYLLQEHEMKFDKIISDDVKASAKKMTFKELGIDLDGETQALVFDATLQKERNPFMFGQYLKGYVKNHSVGMQYVKLALAIDSNHEADKEEKENWDKYYPLIANKEDVTKGYFWAILEAKLIEGSAVLRGSNWATPTLTTEAVNNTSNNKNEAANALQEFYKSLI